MLQVVSASETRLHVQQLSTDELKTVKKNCEHNQECSNCILVNSGVACINIVKEELNKRTDIEQS
jgi:hypothetical protein